MVKYVTEYLYSIPDDLNRLLHTWGLRIILVQCGFIMRVENHTIKGEGLRCKQPKEFTNGKKRQTFSKDFKTKVVLEALWEESTIQECCKAWIASVVSEINSGLDQMVGELRSRKLDAVYPVIWADALYEKIRDNHRIVSKAVMVIKAVNLERQQEILSVEPMENESEETYSALFRKLKD